MIDLIGRLIEPVSGILDKVVTDKDERNRLAHEISTMAERHAQALALAQIELNRVEAEHSSVFVSGWRPAAGWVATAGLLYQTILVNFLGIWFEMPEIDSMLLVGILGGMLGLGGLRSFEKKSGVNHLH